MTTFYCVRHGEAENNVGIITSDPKLTGLGEVQAQELAQKFSSLKFDLFISSHKLRTLTTLLILTNKEKQLMVDPAIKEINPFGNTGYDPDLERRNHQFLKDMPGPEKWTFKTNGGESFSEGGERMLKYIKKTSLEYPEATILLVGHGRALRALLCHLGYTDKNVMEEFRLNNCGYFILDWTSESDFKIKEVVGLVPRKQK